MSTLSISSLFPFKRVTVMASNVSPESDLALFSVGPDKRYRPVCSECKSQGTNVHSRHSRVVRDIPIGPFNRVRVSVNYRKIDCPQCGRIRVEDNEIINPGGPRVTKRLAKMVQDLCRIMTINEVATYLELDWKTVKDIDKQALKDTFSKVDYSNLHYLAVDEISYKKYQNYLTIVIDFITGRVVWIGQGRKKDTLDEFFASMPEEKRKGIKAVAMDMWEPYRLSVEEWCPKSAIVFDVFHIVKKYNEVIDTVRRSEMRKASTKEEQKKIKGSRWILLKNSDKLGQTELPRLTDLLEANENLYKAYVLKDDLKEIWRQPDRASTKEALDAWCARAEQAKVPTITKFVQTLRSHAYGILNHSDYPIHNGRLEGINNKIGVLKRKTYGFHDLEYFCLKIKQHCQGRSTPP